MKTVLVIGIGAGDPDYVTIQAIKALNRLDVIIVVEKGEQKDGLTQLRTTICEQYIDRPYRTVTIDDPERERTASDYRSAVARWRQKRIEAYESALVQEVGEDETCGFLVWGDPSIYDGTIAMLDEIKKLGNVDLEYEIVPGISSVQALASRHRIALNRIGESIHITTGRRLAEGLPAADNIVVMLDGSQAYSRVLGQNLEIFWGAYVGSENEMLISGSLDEVADTISVERQEARERMGWIMDTYLLRTREQR